MAKGLRSKCKRHNRALIRKNLTEPINRKRQEEMAAALQKELDERKGTSIRSLTLLAGKDATNVEMAENEDEGSEDEEEEEPVKEGAKKKGFSFLRRNPKSKGSKPRNNPGKKLEWFK